MEPARARSSRRRPRRGSLERPLDGRLVRASALVALLPLALMLFSLLNPGALAAPALPPAFDGRTAAALAEELETEHPARPPGDLGSAAWLTEKLALYGIAVSTDVWTEELPDAGRVELRNLVAVVPGETRQAIVVEAHRDTGPGDGGAVDGSGTAALVELARAYAAPSTGGARARPEHTLVFLSTDGGAFGGVGAARFVARSPLRDRLLAALSLDRLDGADLRLELSADGPRSPAAALVRTAIVRAREQTGTGPRLPGALRQVADLGLRFGYGGQAPFLGAGITALGIDSTGPPAGAPTSEAARERSLGRNGRAVEALLGSLDVGVELARSTAPAVYVGGRAIRGWTLALLLGTLVLPFLVGTIDLVAHCRRRGIALGPALGALALRLGVWGWLVALVGVAALVGVLPTGTDRPLPPEGAAARDWPVAGLAVLALAGAAGWAVAARRLRPVRPPTSGEELAGHAAALVLLGVLAVVVAVARPYALVFLVPSLLAWLLLLQARRRRVRTLLLVAGLLGPFLALLSFAARFGLGLDAPLYAISLVTVGATPWLDLVLWGAWGAVAAQLTAIALRRYAPLGARAGAEGAEALGPAAVAQPRRR